MEGWRRRGEKGGRREKFVGDQASAEADGAAAQVLVEVSLAWFDNGLGRGGSIGGWGSSEKAPTEFELRDASPVGEKTEVS